MPATVDLPFVVEVDQIHQQFAARGAGETGGVPAQPRARPRGEHRHFSTADVFATLEYAERLDYSILCEGAYSWNTPEHRFKRPPGVTQSSAERNKSHTQLSSVCFANERCVRASTGWDLLIQTTEGGGYFCPKSRSKDGHTRLNCPCQCVSEQCVFPLVPS